MKFYWNILYEAFLATWDSFALRPCWKLFKWIVRTEKVQRQSPISLNLGPEHICSFCALEPELEKPREAPWFWESMLILWIMCLHGADLFAVHHDFKHLLSKKENLRKVLGYTNSNTSNIACQRQEWHVGMEYIQKTCVDFTRCITSNFSPFFAPKKSYFQAHLRLKKFSCFHPDKIALIALHQLAKSKCSSQRQMMLSKKTPVFKQKKKTPNKVMNWTMPLLRRKPSGYKSHSIRLRCHWHKKFRMLSCDHQNPTELAKLIMECLLAEYAMSFVNSQSFLTFLKRRFMSENLRNTLYL